MPLSKGAFIGIVTVLVILCIAVLATIIIVPTVVCLSRSSVPSEFVCLNDIAIKQATQQSGPATPSVGYYADTVSANGKYLFSLTFDQLMTSTRSDVDGTYSNCGIMHYSRTMCLMTQYLFASLDKV